MSNDVYRGYWKDGVRSGGVSIPSHIIHPHSSHTLTSHTPSQADAGGMVSPSGLSYIGRSKEIMGDIPGAIAIKRIHLDEKLARAAQK